MKAKVGDKITIHGHKVGGHVRNGVILEVHGDDGGPPYVVRWSDDDSEEGHLFFPGSDADIESVKR